MNAASLRVLISQKQEMTEIKSVFSYTFTDRYGETKNIDVVNLNPRKLQPTTKDYIYLRVIW